MNDCISTISVFKLVIIYFRQENQNLGRKTKSVGARRCGLHGTLMEDSLSITPYTHTQGTLCDPTGRQAATL